MYNVCIMNSILGVVVMPDHGSPEIAKNFIIALVLLLICGYAYAFYDHIKDVKFYKKYNTDYKYLKVIDNKPKLKENLNFQICNILTVIFIFSFIISKLAIYIGNLI